MAKAKQGKAAKETKEASRGGIFTVLGLLGAGAVAAAAFAASRKSGGQYSVENSDSIDDDLNDDDLVDDAASNPVVVEPMHYTGAGTPDMAVSYVPGADNSEDRVSGFDDQTIGNAEEREALAGVNN